MIKLFKENECVNQKHIHASINNLFKIETQRRLRAPTRMEYSIVKEQDDYHGTGHDGRRTTRPYRGVSTRFHPCKVQGEMIIGTRLSNAIYRGPNRA